MTFPDNGEPVSRVFVRGLRVSARIGCYEEERHRTQPLVLDIELTLDTDSFDDGDLSRTVDYTQLAGFAEELAGAHIDLVETFAERLARRCLAVDHVVAARIRVEKPEALRNGLAGAEVVRYRPAR